MDTAMRARKPVHLWIVGALATLWNGFGAYDFLMTQTRNPAYLSQYSAEERAWFDAFPAWIDGFWALAVWGGLAGSLLLLARRRYAAPAFLGSMVGMFVGLGYQLEAARPESLAAGPMAWSPYGIIAVGVALLLYARLMAENGSLR